MKPEFFQMLESINQQIKEGDLEIETHIGMVKSKVPSTEEIKDVSNKKHVIESILDEMLGISKEEPSSSEETELISPDELNRKMDIFFENIQEDEHIKPISEQINQYLTTLQGTGKELDVHSSAAILIRVVEKIIITTMGKLQVDKSKQMMEYILNDDDSFILEAVRRITPLTKAENEEELTRAINLHLLNLGEQLIALQATFTYFHFAVQDLKTLVEKRKQEEKTDGE